MYAENEKYVLHRSLEVRYSVLQKTFSKSIFDGSASIGFKLILHQVLETERLSGSPLR